LLLEHLAAVVEVRRWCGGNQFSFPEVSLLEGAAHEEAIGIPHCFQDNVTNQQASGDLVE